MNLIDRLSATELAERQEISRQVIKEQLQLLASVEEQLDYQRQVPGINVIDELVCGWFDDSYRPDDEIFVTGFSVEELDVLSKFSEVFESVFQQIKDNQVSEIAVLVRTPYWLHLMEAASSTLRVFTASTCSSYN